MGGNSVGYLWISRVRILVNGRSKYFCSIEATIYNNIGTNENVNVKRFTKTNETLIKKFFKIIKWSKSIK